MKSFWNWIKKMNIDGIIAIPLAIYFFIGGLKFYAGIMVGVLISKNLELIKKWFKEKF